MARVFELPETKRGVFTVSGVVNGTESDRFYKEMTTRTNQDFRMLNFGVQYERNKTIYVSMNGMPTEKVYFSKKDETGKTVVKDVPWSKRYVGPDGDGWNLIGVRVGLTQELNDKGRAQNVSQNMSSYDACEYVRDHLKDDISVNVRGTIENSTYRDKNGNQMHSTKYVPYSIYLCYRDFDLDNLDELDDKHKPKHSFTQTIIFMGITKEMVDNKATGRFVVAAKVVTYSSVEDVEYFITDASLASLFKKNLKPYTSIEVWGRIEVSHNLEAVAADDDCWGQANEMKAVTAPSKVEFVITGAGASTRDTETYNEDKIAEAIRKINASKQAETKFTGKTNTSNPPWGVDNDDDDMDEDWG